MKLNLRQLRNIIKEAMAEPVGKFDSAAAGAADWSRSQGADPHGIEDDIAVAYDAAFMALKKVSSGIKLEPSTRREVLGHVRLLRSTLDKIESTMSAGRSAIYLEEYEE